MKNTYRCVVANMEMIEFNKDLLEELLAAARRNPRLRQGRDMRTSEADSSQRMLNALLLGTVVAVHRHPRSAETVVCLRGRMDEVIFEERDGRLVEAERIRLCPEEGCYGCQVPPGAWHTVEVVEPSVILEAKDGAYGADGSEMWNEKQ